MFEFQRLHWVASITGVLEVIKQNVLTVIILLIVGSRNESPYFTWFIGLGLISAFGLGIMSWFRFKYKLLEDEIHIYKGIFVQKKLYIHKNRVQVTEISAGIIQRLFGLVSLTIQTAGGGSERAVLSALNTQTANSIVEVLNPKGIEHGGLESTLSQDEHQEFIRSKQTKVLIRKIALIYTMAKILSGPCLISAYSIWH